MRTAATVVCTVFLAVLAGFAGCQARAAQGGDLASPWVELHAGRVRLVAGPAPEKPAKAYLAGVEITLADGWKTYWRMPGDAGVPPIFNWTGSNNVASVKVLYPAPHRMREPAAETIGYAGAVVFPVEVVPREAGKPVLLKLETEFGICREICIPAQTELSLELPPTALAGTAVPAIQASLERVPRAPAARRAGDPQLVGVAANLEGPDPRLHVEARFPAGAKGADLFVEAPDGLYVPLPKRLADGAGGTVRFELDVGRGGNAKDLAGKTLTFTLVGDTGASESIWTLP
jgi:DsbC/DsbD-like thiol-disulfide interchange protein